MARTYRRKTNRGSVKMDYIMAAVRRVKDGDAVRQVAKEMNIDKSMLSRYVKKSSCGEIRCCGYWGNRRVFSEEEESVLCEYLLTSCRMYFGLTPIEVRKLAYQLALKNNKTMPYNWLEQCIAGLDWFQGFVRRHREISLRTPEPTSLSRATSFNKHNVSEFFRLLDEVKSKYHFESKDIYNVDETGCMTVQKTAKVIAPTGSKQVGAMTSAERGQLVTLCCAVNANGQVLPPLFVFPRVHFRDHFIRDGPPGSTGTAHSSGWMTACGFLIFMKHFVKQVCWIPYQTFRRYFGRKGITVITVFKCNNLVFCNRHYCVVRFIVQVLV